MALFLTAAKVRQIVREELDPISSQLLIIKTKLNTIMATQAELATELAARTAQIRKAFDEVTAKLDALMNAVNNAPVTPELRAAADALGAAVQAVDDIVPDAPPAP